MGKIATLTVFYMATLYSQTAPANAGFELEAALSNGAKRMSSRL